jgi:hypothetical protein
VLVLALLGGGAAALWFFGGKRATAPKMGGQDRDDLSGDQAA